jgi:hypothetical protein
MNLADTTLLATPLLCAAAAGIGAAHAQMGWFSWLFVLPGFAIGFGCGIVIRGVAMALLFASGKQPRPFVEFVSVIAYMFIPMLAMFGAGAGTAWLSNWIAQRLT